MEEIVTAKIKVDFDDSLETQVLVRKVVLDEDGTCLGIYGLGQNGQWLEIPEGSPYPVECHLPVTLFSHGPISF